MTFPEILSYICNCAEQIFAICPMFPSVGSSEKGQGDVANTYGDDRLTLVNTVHLERPPGEFFEVHQVRTIVDSRFRQFLEAIKRGQVGIWNTCGGKDLPWATSCTSRGPVTVSPGCMDPPAQANLQ